MRGCLEWCGRSDSKNYIFRDCRGEGVNSYVVRECIIHTSVCGYIALPYDDRQLFRVWFYN